MLVGSFVTLLIVYILEVSLFAFYFHFLGIGPLSIIVVAISALLGNTGYSLVKEIISKEREVNKEI